MRKMLGIHVGNWREGRLMRGRFSMIALVALTGCATMIRGTEQEVFINSEPEGAEVTISNGMQCVTPCRLKAQRKESLQITIRKEGCNTITTAMIPTLAGAGAILGGLIDYGTGAVYDLQPNPLFVTLTCEKT